MEEARIDKWLWHARLASTRTQASRLVEDGHLRINGKKIDKAHHAVRPGDVLTVATDGGVRVIRVLGLTDRRVGFQIARGLYQDIAKG